MLDISDPGSFQTIGFKSGAQLGSYHVKLHVVQIRWKPKKLN